MTLAIGLKGLLKVDLRWYRNGMAEMRHSIVKGAFNNYVDKKMEVGVSKGQLISKCLYEMIVSSKIPTKIFPGFLS